MNPAHQSLTDTQGASASAAVGTVASLPQQDRESAAWAAFATASASDEFCRAWLVLQCSMVKEVRAALLLLRDDAAQSYVPAAIWPNDQCDVSYLTQAAQAVIERSGSVVRGLEPADREGVAADSIHLAYPVQTDADLQGVVVLDLSLRSEQPLQLAQRQLLWGAGWVEALLRRKKALRDSRELERAAVALDIVQAVHEHTRLDPAAMAAVNELATRCRADRVSLGVEHRGRLTLRAI